jgi:hypothetical protein
MIDRDEHLAGDGDDRSLVTASLEYSQVEASQSRIVARGMLRCLDEYPSYPFVAFPDDVAVDRLVS